MPQAADTQHDPVAVAYWRSCLCEFCRESLAELGLAEKAEHPEQVEQEEEPAAPKLKLDPKKRAKLVVQLRAAGYSVAEIAKDLQCSRQRVHQLLAKADKAAKAEKTTES